MSEPDAFSATTVSSASAEPIAAQSAAQRLQKIERPAPKGKLFCQRGHKADAQRSPPEGRALGQSRLFRREQQLCSRRQQPPEHGRLGQDPALSRKRRLFRFPYQSFHGAPSCRRTLYHTAAPFCKQFFVHAKKFHSKD